MSSQAHGNRTVRGGASAGTREGLTTAGRAGFVARGVVYVLVGVLALRIAFGGSGKQADRQGALQEIGSQPLGTVMLWVLAAGFACMTVWRASQAFIGTDGSGGSGRSGGSGGSGRQKEMGKRLMNAGRAVFYAFVCWGTATYAAGSGGGSGSSDSKSKDWTRTVLQWTGGRWLVAIAGCGLVAAGVVIAVRAAQRKFLKKLETGRMGRRTRTAVSASGTGGGVARGAVFAGAGVFAVVAAVRFDPHKAHGMDDTLRSFAHTPAGPWLLVVIAVGLILFGCFSFASARWRRL
jgi:hypothetical protein